MYYFYFDHSDYCGDPFVSRDGFIHSDDHRGDHRSDQSKCT